MGLLAELTYVHMEANSEIDRIGRGLHRLRVRGEDPDFAGREINQLITVALRVRHELKTFFDRERGELFPLAQRILGSDLMDLKKLVETQDAVIASLDRFIVALSGMEKGGLSVEESRLVDLESCFRDLLECYDEHCAVERGFFATHSTILFPGGVATE